jgi:hypothetical protein
MPRILRPLSAVPVKQPAAPSQDDQALLSRIQGVLQRGSLVVRAQTVQALQVGGDATVQRRLSAGTLTAAAGTITTLTTSSPIARGRLGGFETNAGSSGFTAETALGVSAPATVGASRRLMIVGKAIFSSTVAGDIVQLNIKEGTNYLDQANGPIATAGGNTTITAHAFLPNLTYPALSAGSHIYFLSASRTGGTGTITMAAGATFLACIEIYDMGGQ